MTLNEGAIKAVRLWNKYADRSAQSNAMLVYLDGMYYRLQFTGYFRIFEDDLKNLVPKVEYVLGDLFYMLKRSTIPAKVFEHVYNSQVKKNWMTKPQMLFSSLGTPIWKTDINDMLGIHITRVGYERARVIITYQDYTAVVGTICIKGKGE